MFDILKKIVPPMKWARMWGAAVINIMNVAAGKHEAYLDNLKPWDIAAGALLVTEAGGSITDLEGNKDNWQSGNIVVSNSGIHDKMTRIIAPCFKNSPV